MTSEPPVLVLSDALMRDLLDAARAAGPREICGFIVHDDKAVQCLPVSNIATRSHDRFIMDPAEQIAVFRQIREQGQTLGAIYHSHPRGEARPSRHDIDGHGYPRIPALIIAPAARHGAVMQAWMMHTQPPQPLPITTTARFL
ncbi:Mov34/MPN/PAD-1 family protein [Salinisphaera sp. Q1T1-3]|uniref:Mov34/MPN/PAD-1 family protein n=1 Tax=Salinisphaera sp. Q1T1-3 TaxID=2321229 RepID=UPI000E73000F|nr:M67 family metallopeptidase [Salinisphaera sp. Q1T1-3]RJS94425.1 M67 family peptidase [Salinisphaera sp. Q1T1-3]